MESLLFFLTISYAIMVEMQKVSALVDMHWGDRFPMIFKREIEGLSQHLPVQASN